MPETAPTQREVEELRKSLADERRRVDHLVVRINEVLAHGKQNDDRIEQRVKAMEARLSRPGAAT